MYGGEGGIIWRWIKTSLMNRVALASDVCGCRFIQLPDKLLVSLYKHDSMEYITVINRVRCYQTL